MTNIFRRKGDFGIPMIIGILLLSTILGVIMFKNYVHSVKEIAESQAQMQKDAPTLTIESCANRTMNWYENCNVMAQLCDDAVPRMMKICLVNGDKTAQCSLYGTEVSDYNFGIKQCDPYLHDRKQIKSKKACADIWQSVANYCKSR